jgi:hypothetical protein
MTAMLRPSNGPPAPARADAGNDPAGELIRAFAPVRLRFTWFGVERSLTPEQKAQAAEPFQASARALRAAKRLLDTKPPSFRAVTAIRGKVEFYFRGITNPYPEPGIRLVRREKVGELEGTLRDLRAELDDAVARLDEKYHELRDAARAELGGLFDPLDYPDTLMGLFGYEHDFPNLTEPPRFLVDSPELYERESRRIRERFEEAVRLTEEAFLAEFLAMVQHVCERITGSAEDGNPKVFRDSEVNNLVEFFERFRALNVNSNAQLDELVDRAQRAVRGVAAQDLRDSNGLRRRVAQQLGQVGTALDAMLIDRPRRRVLRQAAPAGEAR